jgi:hypothetical protein
MRARTTRLEAKAILGRWPISPEVRARTIKRLANIVTNKKASRREVTAAARALIAADALSLAEEKANDGYTQEELLAKWQEAVDAGVAAELARREVRRIEGGGSDQPAAEVVPTRTVPEAETVPARGGT